MDSPERAARGITNDYLKAIKPLIENPTSSAKALKKKYMNLENHVNGSPQNESVQNALIAIKDFIEAKQKAKNIKTGANISNLWNGIIGLGAAAGSLLGIGSSGQPPTFIDGHTDVSEEKKAASAAINAAIAIYEKSESLNGWIPGPPFAKEKKEPEAAKITDNIKPITTTRDVDEPLSTAPVAVAPANNAAIKRLELANALTKTLKSRRDGPPFAPPTKLPNIKTKNISGVTPTTTIDVEEPIPPAPVTAANKATTKIDFVLNSGYKFSEDSEGSNFKIINTINNTVSASMESVQSPAGATSTRMVFHDFNNAETMFEYLRKNSPNANAFTINSTSKEDAAKAADNIRKEFRNAKITFASTTPGFEDLNRLYAIDPPSKTPKPGM